MLAMHDDRSHPLLAQIPLTVSPFISLPTATTLPYTYKTLPSTLPPSSTGNTATSAEEKQKYVVSSSGHAAHPDDIVKSCKALQEYIKKVQDDADRELKVWNDQIEARELAEKRRVAPGWLDSDARILEPERVDSRSASHAATLAAPMNLMDTDNLRTEMSGANQFQTSVDDRDGEELDKAFGGLGMK